MLDPLVTQRLSDVRSHNEAVQVWTECWDALDGYLFVLSQPGALTGRWPARLDLNGGGYLRSLFAHDNLWFTSHGIMESMFGDCQRIDLPIDYSIGFDSNVAQYLCNLVEGRNIEVVSEFRATLRQLAAHRFNWELMPFLQERAEAVVAGQDLDSIWRIVYAAEYFAGCDLSHFALTGELHLEKSESEVTASAQTALSDWHRLLTHGVISRFKASHALYHSLLLKIALLYRRRPAPRDAAHNLGEFLEFMCDTVGINLPWMLWAADGLFERGGGFEPLRKLTAPRDSLIANCRNIAWDVAHYLERRLMAKPIGRGGAFLLPYTLTFDRGLAQWFDGQAQRSCIMTERQPMPQFFADRNIEGEILQKFGHVRAFVELAGRHLTLDAHLERAESLRSRERDLPLIVAELEAAVAGLP